MANGITLKYIIEIFLVSIAWTLTLFSPIADPKMTGSGLVKLLGHIAMGALGLSLFNDFFSVNFLSMAFIFKILSLLALSIVAFKHPEEKTPLMWLMYFVVVILLGAQLILLAPKFFDGIFYLSSGLMLGSILYAMILGHWYLVVPKLSARPLKLAALFIWLILGLKIILSTSNLFGHLDFFKEGTSRGEGMAFNWLLLLMRLMFGYAIILGISIFNWKLLKIRSIQSSTGLLYVMTFFCFIGEIVSLYMHFNMGLFI